MDISLIIYTFKEACNFIISVFKRQCVISA